MQGLYFERARNRCAPCYNKDLAERALEKYQAPHGRTACFDDFLVLMRLYPDLTVKEAAEKLGVASRTVIRYRRRKRELDGSQECG